MPSITPSNSRRRNSRMPTTNAPLAASSNSGADTTADTLSPLPCPSSRSPTTSAVLLISNAVIVAPHAPQPKASQSRPAGSGSQRSTQRKAATTGPTGSSAALTPTSSASTPYRAVASASNASPHPASTTRPSTGSSTVKRRDPRPGPVTQ